MLRHRVIPVVLLDGFSVLKTIQFGVRRNLGSPITVARIYSSRNVDELVLLDIDAEKQGRSIDIFTIEEVAAQLFMPLTVGGGIKTVEDIRKCLAKGADKVSINSEALKRPAFIEEASSVFGNQCIVVSVDLKLENGEYKIRLNDGRLSDRDPFEWIQQAEALGAGELLINSVDRDGVMQGPDLALIERVSKITKVPLIVAGGVGAVEHCSQMIQSGASAAAASSIFHFTSITPSECRQHMDSVGIPVRLSL